MSLAAMTVHPRPLSVTRSTHASTRRLLACGVIAGPLFVAAGTAQIFTRPGFDITRHALSLLSNGDYGWVQMLNFLVTGSLTIACAVGLRRVLRGVPGGRWAPLLVGIYGLGFAAASVFSADPEDGFPIGTPAGMSSAMSTHSIVHMIAGSVAFLSLIATCYVLARAFGARGERRWMLGSLVAGAIFTLGLGEAMVDGPAGWLSLFATASIALVWVALVAAHLRQGEPA